MTSFTMRAARAVAPYALTVSSLVPMALPHRGLEEALNERDQAMVRSWNASMLPTMAWGPLEELTTHLLSDVNFQ